MGLGPVFGEEAPYLQSDIQFAKQVSHYFWGLRNDYEDYYDNKGKLYRRLSLDLQYGFKSYLQDQSTDSEGENYIIASSYLKVLVGDSLRAKYPASNFYIAG